MSLRPIGDGIWLLQYPLGLLGLPIGRNVTVIHLRSGRVLIHSTAPFTATDVAAITALGQPGWLIDASLFHDSFAQEGRRAFPGVPYLAPEGLKAPVGISAESLETSPPEWSPDVEVLRLAGVKANEHALFHRPSKTLIVCDLLFNFGGETPRSTRWVARHLMRLRDGIGMSAFFKLTIRDRDAFQQSLAQVMAWDFERIIVGHGDVIESNGKRVAADHFARAGFKVP